MKRIVLIFAALVILVTVCLGAQELFSRKLVPADAEWAVQVNINTLQKSRLYGMIEQSEAPREMQRARESILRHYQVDILKNIERITLIGLRPDAEPVVCFEGDIPRKHLLGLLGEERTHREIPFGSTVIHTWGVRKNGAFVGDRMAAVSEDLDSLKQVLSVLGGEKPEFKPEGLLPRVPVQPGVSLVTGFFRDVSAMLGHERGPAILTKFKAAIFQAAEKAEDVLLSLYVDTPSAPDAEQVRQVVQGLIALASMEREERGFKFDPRNLSVSVEKNRVNILLTAPLKTVFDVLQGRGRIRGFGPLEDVFFHL
ncbi:MAG: hypothetical protein OEW05_08500 [Candidatus Aminicenantes bacterium]|nr:hypothetical protein [Candidatus Aminicenantes bacterium]